MFIETPLSAQGLLESARDELRRAEYHLAANEFGRTCFYCRRSVERLFQSFLYAHGVKLPKQHQLTRLVERCVKLDASLQGFRQAARHLDQYYIGDLPDDRLMKRPYTEEEAKFALAISEQMINSTMPSILKSVEETP